MRDALLRDLSELNQYEVTVLLDHRLPPPLYDVHSLTVQAGTFNAMLQAAIKTADLFWLIAPETDGVLIDLAQLCLNTESMGAMPKYIGCGEDSTLMGTSKTLTFEALQSAKIHTLPVYAADEMIESPMFESLLKQNVKTWVAKPEDGAGCEGIRLFESLDALRDWLKQDDRYLNYLVQPFQTGVAASFSFLCGGNQAWLLAANQQHIACDGKTFKLTGITLNGMLPYWQRFETIMRKLIKILPDALGYVGVDVIIDPESDQIYVLEINPRLTSSYIGLAQAIGQNPAKIILDCLLDPHFKMPHLQKNVVEIPL